MQSSFIILTLSFTSTKHTHTQIAHTRTHTQTFLSIHSIMKCYRHLISFVVSFPCRGGISGWHLMCISLALFMFINSISKCLFNTSSFASKFVYTFAQVYLLPVQEPFLSIFRPNGICDRVWFFHHSVDCLSTCCTNEEYQKVTWQWTISYSRQWPDTEEMWTRKSTETSWKFAHFHERRYFHRRVYTIPYSCYATAEKHSHHRICRIQLIKARMCSFSDSTVLTNQ